MGMDNKLLFVFDVESDGLYGEGFAVGAVVLTSSGNLYDTFSGMSEVDSVENEWVKENVIPKLKKLEVYESKKDLRSAFWKFFQKYKNKSTIWADIGCPVEANFIIQCVKDDSGRMWDGPYPLNEVATLFVANGIDPDINREEFSESYISENEKHNPLYDSMVSAKCIVKLQQMGSKVKY